MAGMAMSPTNVRASWAAAAGYFVRNSAVANQAFDGHEGEGKCYQDLKILTVRLGWG